MDVQATCITTRLAVKPLAITDDNFIRELVNTEGWIQFIGNRNISSRAAATAYIQKILENRNIAYWVVSLRESEEKIGIVTYIKRDYLEHPDIGFAFLPAFCKKGYAFEATASVLHQLVANHCFSYIFATTLPGNVRSIKLLKRLGLDFEKEIEVEKEKLHVYAAPLDKLLI